MKASIEFTLPEEREEHETAINGWRYRLAINDVMEHVRARLKYGEDLTEEASKELEQVRACILESLEGVSL